jgi:hypothetical protein
MARDSFTVSTKDAARNVCTLTDALVGPGSGVRRGILGIELNAALELTQLSEDDHRNEVTGEAIENIERE